MGKITLNNRGPGPLRVPGTEDIGHCYELPEEDRFTHGFAEWRQIPSITKKELLMLRVMEAFTDRSTWTKDIFDAMVVEEWKTHLFATEPLMSTAVFEWCVLELQDKAQEAEATGIVNVLDLGAACCKSDTLMDSKFCKDLAVAVSNLEVTQERHSKYRGPGRHRIVNPNACALRFDETKVLHLPHIVDVRDPFNARGESHPLHALQPDEHDNSTHLRDYALEDPYTWECEHYFSDFYQWLPFELSFSRDQKLVVASYVNDVHPFSSADLYPLIARCAEISVKMWNRVCQKHGLFNGRCPPRIKTFGVEWWQTESRFKNSFDLFRRGSKSKYFTELDRTELQDWAHKILASQSTAPPEFDMLAIADESGMESIYNDRLVERAWSGTLPPAPISSWNIDVHDMDQALLRKWRSSRRWKHPEPGSRYSYQEWKHGENLKAIIDSPADNRPDLDHENLSSSIFEYHDLDLGSQFRKAGLQMHLEIIKYRLTPGHNCIDATEFIFAGNLNEHIVATSLICFDMHNVHSDSGIEFRHAVDNDGVLHENDCYNFHDLELQEIFDLPELEVRVGGGNAIIPSLQDRGCLKFQKGRSIAWPNTLQYRFRAVSLSNPSEDGCLSLLVLHLVDPNYRICSTLNVQPQQKDWVARESIQAARLPLPQELIDMIEKDLYGPIAKSEAEQATEDVEADKTYFQQRSEARLGIYNSSYVSKMS